MGEVSGPGGIHGIGPQPVRTTAPSDAITDVPHRLPAHKAQSVREVHSSEEVVAKKEQLNQAAVPDSAWKRVAGFFGTLIFGTLALPFAIVPVIGKLIGFVASNNPDGPELGWQFGKRLMFPSLVLFPLVEGSLKWLTTGGAIAARHVEEAELDTRDSDLDDLFEERQADILLNNRTAVSTPADAVLTFEQGDSPPSAASVTFQQPPQPSTEVGGEFDGVDLNALAPDYIPAVRVSDNAPVAAESRVEFVCSEKCFNELASDLNTSSNRHIFHTLESVLEKIPKEQHLTVLTGILPLLEVHIQAVIADFTFKSICEEIEKQRAGSQDRKLTPEQQNIFLKQLIIAASYTSDNEPMFASMRENFSPEIQKMVALELILGGARALLGIKDVKDEDIQRRMIQRYEIALLGIRDVIRKDIQNKILLELIDRSPTPDNQQIPALKLAAIVFDYKALLKDAPEKLRRFNVLVKTS